MRGQLVGTRDGNRRIAVERSVSGGGRRRHDWEMAVEQRLRGEAARRSGKVEGRSCTRRRGKGEAGGCCHRWCRGRKGVDKGGMK